MNFFSYKIEHDYGLAPNPFHGYCTLAVCKSDIRKNKKLQIGDWIIGTGSAALKCLNKLIYAMKIEEKIFFNDYWGDRRFISKRPSLNGSLVQLYGDNFYHIDSETNTKTQENSAHSLFDGSVNQEHLRRDTDGKYVLISKQFYYFGDNAPKVPHSLKSICSNGRNYKSNSIPNKIGLRFIDWLSDNYKVGIYGDPISWAKHQ